MYYNKALVYETLEKASMEKTLQEELFKGVYTFDIVNCSKEKKMRDIKYQQFREKDLVKIQMTAGI